MHISPAGQLVSVGPVHACPVVTEQWNTCGSPGLLVAGHGGVVQPLPMMFEHAIVRPSSTWPLQLSSRPLQISGPGVWPTHVVHGIAGLYGLEQLCVPRHVPYTFVIGHCRGGMSSSMIPSQSSSIPLHCSGLGVHPAPPSSSLPAPPSSSPLPQISVPSGLHVSPTGHIVCGVG